MSDEQEALVYGRSLKREGAPTDGDVCGIPERGAMRCNKCRKADSWGFAKKFGLLLTGGMYICPEDKGFFPKCFICTKIFESDKDLTGMPAATIECDNCKL